MTLYTSANISRYYAETLVLLFFPGSKFPEDNSGGEPLVNISVEENGDSLVGKVVIKEGEREINAFYSPSDATKSRVSREMLIKLAAGGAMLRAGADFCGTVPPWGMITGVRPAKLCIDMMEKGYSPSEVFDHFTEDFLCSEEKTSLALMTAEREYQFINEERRRECSVYIAIPFCPSRCSYCSFVSYSSPKHLNLIPSYLERLLIDIKNTFEIIRSHGLRIATIYIGGGTPTTLSAPQLELLLQAIKDETDVTMLDEFTVEAGRPDTITEEKLSVLYRNGVTRVSVNAQTLNDSVLSAIGRKHTAKDFLSAYKMAKESGIRDINVDLIAGLPGEHYSSFAESAERIVSLDPANITVHTFYVKRAADSVKNSDVYKREDENTVNALNLAQRSILSAGYVPYYLYKQKNTAANLENAGFAKIGHECLYNIFMMEEVHTVFGIGASGMTKLVSPDPSNMKIERICETKYPYEYLDPEKGSADRRYYELKEACAKFYSKYYF